MSSPPDANSFPILDELVKRSKQLRERAERLNAETKELERLIALTARGPEPGESSVGKNAAQK